MKNTGASNKKNNFRAKEGRKKSVKRPVNKKYGPRSEKTDHPSDESSTPRHKKSSGFEKPSRRREQNDSESGNYYKKSEHKPYHKDNNSPDKPVRRQRNTKDNETGSYYKKSERKPFHKDNNSNDKPVRRQRSTKDNETEGNYKKSEHKSFYKDNNSNDKPVRRQRNTKENSERRSSYDKPARFHDTERTHGEKKFQRKPFKKDTDSSGYSKKETRTHEPGHFANADRRTRQYKPRQEKTESTYYEDTSSHTDERKTRKPRIPKKKTYIGRKHEFRNVDILVQDNTYAKRPSFKDLSETGGIRLNKYIANAGICSRREADTLIETGVITINGKIVTQLGTKVMPGDVVKFNDQVLCGEQLQYLLLNKPKGYITTTDDPQERNTVMEIIKHACKERIYPVGRLDKNTSGLLLFTNDGELAKKLTHPSHHVEKVYKVELDKPLTGADMQKIAEGIELDDGFIKVDAIAYGETKREVGIELHSGKNRIVRRIFESLGYDVVKLDRVVFAGLTKKDLPRGKYRFLSKEEVNILRRIK